MKQSEDVKRPRLDNKRNELAHLIKETTFLQHIILRQLIWNTYNSNHIPCGRVLLPSKISSVISFMNRIMNVLMESLR